LRFQLDEMLSAEVAAIARAQGIDVVSSHECGRNGLTDAEQLRLAASGGRCFVTRNARDFAPLTAELVRRQGEHAGVLIVPRTLRDRHPERIARALVDYAQAHPGGVPSYFLDVL
jgi:predicted nuclease of predicted toxin-antitoxin system